MRRGSPRSRLVLVGSTAASLLLGACSTGGEGDVAPPRESASTSAVPVPTPTPTRTPNPSPAPAPAPAPTPTPAPAVDGPPEVVDTVATGLEAPWGLDFYADGDAIVTERDTRRVLRISGPRHRVRELGVLDAAVPEGEGGLLGVALSPDVEQDRLAYFYLTTATDNRVVRAEVTEDSIGPLEVVLDQIPRGFTHDGGRLAFGPDGMLYVSTGESGVPGLAQDRDSLGGKILRITPDGDPAPGNPFDSPVWSWGHRNVQGLAFDDAGTLWASEFGDDTFDELNRIEAGDNYGWPRVEGPGGGSRFTDPQQTWETAEASPSGLAFTADHLWMASLRGERLWRVAVRGDRAVRPRGFLVGDFGRMRTVAVAPDGTLWLTTSNRDTRGVPQPGDDRILQIQP